MVIKRWIEGLGLVVVGLVLLFWKFTDQQYITIMVVFVCFCGLYGYWKLEKDHEKLKKSLEDAVRSLRREQKEIWQDIMKLESKLD